MTSEEKLRELNLELMKIQDEHDAFVEMNIEAYCLGELDTALQNLRRLQKQLFMKQVEVRDWTERITNNKKIDDFKGE